LSIRLGWYLIEWLILRFLPIILKSNLWLLFFCNLWIPILGLIIRNYHWSCIKILWHILCATQLWDSLLTANIHNSLSYISLSRTLNALEHLFDNACCLLFHLRVSRHPFDDVCDKWFSITKPIKFFIQSADSLQLGTSLVPWIFFTNWKILL
jgi:hypothetical protein